MTTRSPSLVLAASLGMLPATAHAQHVPVWLAAAILSPILVLVLCAVLSFVTRSLRTGAIHAGLTLVWVTLSALASYFVENDYVIWTPLALYVLHALLVLVLIVVGIARRIAGRTPAS